MLYAMNILAAGDGDSSQLIWVIAVIILSVIGAIAGKIKERSQKGPAGPPERRRPGRDESQRDEAYSAPTPRPLPPRSPDTSSRPMPRVPRPPIRGGDRPIGIPKAKAPPPLPPRPQPMPTPVPVSRRPAERAVPRPVAPRSTRPVAPAAVVSERAGPTVVSGDIQVHMEPAAPAHRRRPAALRGAALTARRLREAIVLREVLGPPLALREDELI